MSAMSLFRRNIMMARKASIPITYLTQWKIVGNSEVHGNEIWSCGEYSAVDGKYHILVRPLGGSIADIALDAPLRKVNDVADTIEFPSDTEGKALVTRSLVSLNITNSISTSNTKNNNVRWYIAGNCYSESDSAIADILCNLYEPIPAGQTWNETKGIGVQKSGSVYIYDPDYNQSEDKNAFIAANINTVIICVKKTPTTELVDAPQIEEADSYTCEISQGAKAVEWSSFTTE